MLYSWYKQNHWVQEKSSAKEMKSKEQKLTTTIKSSYRGPHRGGGIRTVINDIRLYWRHLKKRGFILKWTTNNKCKELNNYIQLAEPQSMCSPIKFCNAMAHKIILKKIYGRKLFLSCFPPFFLSGSQKTLHK